MGRRFIAAVLMCLHPVLAGCDAKQAERKHEAQSKRQLEIANQCEVVNQVLAVVRQHGREDLAKYDLGPPCERIKKEDCDYKVELMFELSNARQAALSDQIAPLGPDCTDEQRFAVKYGIEAFRDHRKLLNDAVNDAVNDATEVRDDDSREPEPIGP
jgi:hypothetical protein